MSDGMLQYILGWAESWAGVAWPMLVNSAIIVCLVAIAARLARHRSAAFRYGLWLLVLVRLALPPGFGVSVGLPGGEKVFGGDGRVSAGPIAGIDKATGTPVVVGSQSDPFFAGRPDLGVLASESGSIAGATPEARWHLSWIAVAFMVWVMGVAISALLVAWRMMRLRRQVREMELLESGTVLDLFERCKERMLQSSDFPCSLYISDAFASPAVTGLLRPQIILPRYLVDTLTETELEPLILHELAHVRRRDIAVNWLQIALQILYWPNPVVWLANARLRAERELACDDCVLAVTHFKRRDYGSGLIKVLEVSRQKPAFSMGLFSVSDGSSQVMEHRLRRIMDRRNGGVARLSLPALAGLFLIAAACLAPTVAPAEKEEVVAGEETSLPAEAKATAPAAETPEPTRKRSLWSTLFSGDDETKLTRVDTIDRSIDKDGKLSIENSNGAIALSVWDQPSVRITAEITMKVRGSKDVLSGSDQAAAQYFKSVRVDVSGDEKDLKARTVVPERRRRVSIETKYDVKIPESIYANLKTSNGAVTASGLANGLNAESSNGKINVEQVAGPVRLSTSNGTIRCSKVTGSVDAHTSNGTIDIDLNVLRQSDSRVVARTSNGAIDVTLPRNSAFDVNARTSNGRISTDFPITVQGQLGSKNMSGKVNGGGAEVDLETSNGSIDIRAKGEMKLEATENMPGRDDARVVAARDECFPEEVCKAVLELQEQSLQKLDPAERALHSNMQIVSVDKNSEVWHGIILQRKNVGDTMTGDYSLGNTDAREPIIILDETGAVLKHRRLMRKASGPGQFELVVQIEKPWEANQAKQFLWICSGGHAKETTDNQRQVCLQNVMGPEGIQQLAFLRPTQLTIKSQSEQPALAESRANVEILIWQKHVRAGENYRVDLTTSEAAAEI